MLVQQLLRGLDARDRQPRAMDQPELHQPRSLIPVDVLVIELVAAEADDGDQ
jgi:hypothetical protein